TEVLGAVAAAGAGTPSAAAAVDMAVHGLAASALGVPVAGAHLAGLACVTERSPYPVMADESVFTAADARRVADARAADLVNLKLLKCGGLFPARELVAVCAEAGLGLLVGCMLEPAEGIAVAQALASVASAGPLAHDLDAGWWVAPPSS
ncbi:MAG: enolase C-terminal domain-like protein, partial [Blastococcus sp.]